MKVHHSLICFFLLTGLINAEILHYKGTEGANITVGCNFTVSGDRKFFCKGKCETENILIQTTDDRAQEGRYSIKYEKGRLSLLNPTLYVSIRQLTESDSGRYRCALDRTFLRDGFSDFEISVTDAPSTSKPDRTSAPSASTPPAQSFTPSSSSPETTEQSDQQQTESPTSAAPARPGVLLYVRLVLIIMVILLSLALLIFCRKRTNNPKDPPADTEYTSVTQANRVYEEVREDRQSRSPPEVSTVYAKYTKPTENTNTYSLAAAASSQHEFPVTYKTLGPVSTCEDSTCRTSRD